MRKILAFILAQFQLINAQPMSLGAELQAILDKTVDSKKVFGAAFALKQGDKFWQGAAGDLSLEQPFFIASTTKLFTTALILDLRSKGKLNLDDKISQYLSADICSKLPKAYTDPWSQTQLPL